MGVHVGRLNHDSKAPKRATTVVERARGMNGRHWTPDKIVQTLKRLHRKGTPMWSRRLRETHGPLHAAAIHRFGSFQKAIEAAGIEYTDIQRTIPGRWNRQTIAAEFKRLHKLGTPLHHAAIERQHAPLMVAAYRYFGSYGKAIRAAGLDYERIRIRPMPTWDQGRVVKFLRQLKREDHGLWPRAIRRENSYLVRAAIRCFGSYERAAKKTGIDAGEIRPPPYRQWSPQRIIDELRQLYRSGHSQLKPTRLDATHPKLLRACRRRFGSYEKALQAAGIDYARVARVQSPPLDRAEILAWIEKLHDQGADLRYAAMKRKHSRLLEAARGRFGSYGQAVESAGLDYPPAPPLRHWTANLVLKTLRQHYTRKVDLRYRIFRKTHLPLFEAARHYFGTYLQALRRAKIDYDAMVQEQLSRQLPRRKKMR